MRDKRLDKFAIDLRDDREEPKDLRPKDLPIENNSHSDSDYDQHSVEKHSLEITKQASQGSRHSSV